MRHFLSIVDTSTERLLAILRRAVALRSRAAPVLRGRTVCCLFEKPSLRTRVSFEQAARLLGGDVMSLHQHEVGLGSRESVEDVARVLSSMVDCIVARVKSHGALERMAAVSAAPVINGLSERAHPAQALADVLTMADEFAPDDASALSGRGAAWVGDWNNVARSFCAACARLGVRVVACCPPGYGPPAGWAEGIGGSAPGFSLETETDPRRAVRGVDAVYCDTFVSMGQESEREKRLRDFAGYRVDEALLSHAPGHAIVLHCLPAQRGVEITDGVMDGPRSRVFQQARNRLDAQAGLLAEIFDPSEV